MRYEMLRSSGSQEGGMVLVRRRRRDTVGSRVLFGPRVSGDISLRMMRSLGAEESGAAQQI